EVRVRGREPSAAGAVGVFAVRAREIQAVELAGEVRHGDVEPAIAIDIGDIDAHARQRLPVLIDGDADLERDLSERAVAEILPQEVRRRVVRDVDVDEAIAVEIERDHAEPLAVLGARASDAGAFADLAEGPVAEVL